MALYKNNLREFTEERLTIKQHAELYNNIVQSDITPSQRQRDFRGTLNVPLIRKKIYHRLISGHLPGISIFDLFPAENAANQID